MRQEGQFYDIREKMARKQRKENHEKRILELRAETLNKLFPLQSETLAAFHEIVSNDLELEMERITACIASENLQALKKKDYQDLLCDIHYLIDVKKFKFPEITFRSDYQWILPELMADYYAHFHPNTVSKWLDRMDEPLRMYIYLDILIQHRVEYINKEMIEWVSRDLDKDEALQLLKYCLKEGILVKHIISHALRRLFAIMNSSKTLSLNHFIVLYYIILRSIKAHYFNEACDLFLKNEGKFRCQSCQDKTQFKITILKVKGLKEKEPSKSPE